MADPRFPLVGDVLIFDSLEKQFMRIDRAAVLRVAWDGEVVLVQITGMVDPFRITTGEGWAELFVRDITTGSVDSTWEYTKDDEWLRNGEVVPPEETEEKDADGAQDPT